MPNTNTMTTVIPQILAQGLLCLRENAVMPRFVARGYDPTPGEKGSSVDVPVSSAIAVQDVTPSYVPPDDAGQTPTKVSVLLDKWKEAPFFLTDREIDDVTAGYLPMQAQEAVKALANQIDRDILALYKDVYGFAGAAGTTPFATSATEFLQADQILDDQLAPTSGRNFVMNAKAKAAALGLTNIQSAYGRGDTSGIKKGELGEILGANWFMDQNVPRHTAGTITTGLIAKAATAVAAGLKTFVATTAASTGACALVVGDVIAIAGHTTTYVLTAAATQASAASDVTLVFEPALERALVGSEAITVKASHRVNLVFHRDAFALAMRPFSVGDQFGHTRRRGRNAVLIVLNLGGNADQHGSSSCESCNV